MTDIKELKKKFPSGFCLNIDNLSFPDGARIALIGPNGSGKSTLLSVLAGALKADSGIIKSSFHKDEIGYQPQNPYVFRGTVEYNIRLGLKGNADLDEIVKKCKLTDLLDKRADRISGGEKQRVCFARMLAGNYKFLLLDEPFSAADIETSRELTDCLVSFCKKNGTTLIVSTHTPAQALSCATDVLILNNGSVSDYSDVSALRNPESVFGRTFISQWSL